jgi:hypothetical protein
MEAGQKASCIKTTSTSSDDGGREGTESFPFFSTYTTSHSILSPSLLTSQFNIQETFTSIGGSKSEQ